MAAFEVIALGYDGGSDKTDDRVLWVWCETAEWLAGSLKGTYAAGMTTLDHDRLGLQPHEYDFIMPKDVQALHDRLRELAGIPQLAQVMRGAHYIHPTHGVVQFICSHPDDGAYLICQKLEIPDDEEEVYFGCEASDLRFPPPREKAS